MALNFPAEELGSGRFTRSAFLCGSLGLAAAVAGFRPGQLVGTSAAAAAVDGCEWVPWQAAHLLTRSQFNAKLDELGAGGYRLVRISGYETADGLRLAGIWELRPDAERIVEIALSAGKFKEVNAAYQRVGYHLRAVDGFSLTGGARYSGIWEPATGRAPKLRLGMTAAGVRDKLNVLGSEGFAMVDISGFALNGQSRFAGLWHKDAPSTAVEIEMSESDFLATERARVVQGMALVDVSAYAVNAGTRYAAIWIPAVIPAVPNVAQSAASLDRVIEDHRYRGHRAVTVDGYAVGGQPHYATVWRSDGFTPDDEAALADSVESHMKAWDIPGLSLALAKDGRLVYARGFGFADPPPNPDASDAGYYTKPVTVHSRFRIASASKPITAVAIMRLVEERRLKLGDKVLGPGSRLGEDFDGVVWDTAETARMQAVTVRHLLEHTAGWPNDSEDAHPAPNPMAVREDLDRVGLIDVVIKDSTGPGTFTDPDEDNKTFALVHEPGEQWGYSGFGYLLLTRIVEVVTGMSYEDYVKQHIVNDPDSTLEMALQDGLLDNEVSYYGQGLAYESTDGSAGTPVECYTLASGGVSDSWVVWRRAGGGGWVASAVDLVRFMTRVDGEPTTRSDAIDCLTLQRMLRRSTATGGQDQGLGWLLDPDPYTAGSQRVDYWHGGALNSGTNSVMACVTIGESVYCWAAVINTQVPSPRVSTPCDGSASPTHLGSDLDKPMRAFFAALPLQSWPCLDLF